MRNKLAIVLGVVALLFSLAYCGGGNGRRPEPTPGPGPSPGPGPLPADLDMKAQAVKDFLLKSGLEGGWVRGDTNGYWTGLGLSYNCKDMVPLAFGISTSLKDRDGAMVRRDPLPMENQGGQEVEWEGYVGGLAGLSWRSKNCTDDIKGLWSKHLDFLKETWTQEPDALYPGTDVKVKNKYPLAALSKALGLTLESETKAEFEVALAGSPSKEQVGLWLLLEALGDPLSAATKDKICLKTDPILLALCSKDAETKKWLQDWKSGQAVEFLMVYKFWKEPK